MIIVYIWPDGTWCEEEDFSSYSRRLSDDYEKVEMTWEVYEQFVDTH